MSADLLAEFGRASGPAQSSVSQTQAPQSKANSLIPGLGQADDASSGSTMSLWQDQPQDSTLVASRNQHHHSASRQPPCFETFDLPRHQNSEVLFDATVDTPADELDDEWGEFEGPESSSQPKQVAFSNAASEKAKYITPNSQPHQHTQFSANVDLLDSLSLQDLGQQTKPPSPNPLIEILQTQENNPANNPGWDDDSFGDWGEFTKVSPTKTPPQRSLSRSQKPAPRPLPPQPTWDDDAFDDWGDFTDGPSTAPASLSSKPNPTKPSSPPNTRLAPRSFTSGTPATPAAVRPTNIPPPSVLLELLIDILNHLPKEANKAKARDTPTCTRETTASDIHNTLETAARIIAGRALRWKRDTILSQSMRIGPATGKTGGMKLSAVNKHEDVKEEQDAVDVLSLWRERAALFNAVTQASGRRSIPTVPDAGTLKVVTARPEQGALRSSHACALCALKRDERVLRVDEVDVHDSFGEWWTEHWGHTSCYRFWEANRHLLRQR